MDPVDGFPWSSQHTPRPRTTEVAEPEAKRRRKIRKGTRSCWECKRRKIRCNFDSEAAAVCNGCQNRGTKCVSQEFPEEASAPADRSRQMGERIVRVEALVEQLVHSVAAGTTKHAPTLPETGIPTPSSSTSELPHLLSLYESAPATSARETSPSSSSSTPIPPRTASSGTPRISPVGSPLSPRYKALSETLFAAFPSTEDLEILREHGATGVTPFNQLATIPLHVLEVKGAETADAWFKLPDRNLHPVLIGKVAMMLATTLQGLFPSNQAATVGGVSEPPQVIARRLADTVRSLVTNNDEFLGTVEGLQCIIFEGVYQANWGNLRQAWLTMRRAMVVAQLMGIQKAHNHKPLKVIDPKAPIYPQYMWFRIVFADRLLSMMLGLPQGTMDMSMASPAQLAEDVPSGRLERVHCVISARILERNEDPREDDYTKTKDIDSALQKAASMMPGRWWLTPNLTKVGSDPSSTFWEALRLAKQLYHYYLLIQLHLPYMMLSDNANSANSDKAANYEYSKATCVTAAREILTRFVVFRSFNRVAFCCRNIDFWAFLAAMTLLLAYLEGHRKPRTESVLAHQRISDRAMMEEVLDNMECVSKLNDDALSDKCGDVLRRLLAIEEEAASGNRKADADSLDDSIENALRICIPYYGTVKIDPTGNISRDGPSRPQEYSTEASRHDLEAPGTVGSVGMHHRAWGCGLPLLQGEVTAVEPHGAPSPIHHQVLLDGGDLSSHQAGLPFHLDNAINDVQIAAGIDDWTFQGVETAFFDSLMRGTGAPDADDWGQLRL
ncbi:hypothetical protein QBC34DRAFT_400027 [Podospora aff. communis PSN243]|uniref:Zn(2)-C6 fungal-type domain-containing protein n=1 Tax=Podospora aff. communis PSN243 TaxID=3040156 RepID=A0AAV9GW57_9PEZI|nr:hypothetical protein QBC34DRAFT_400027 [Podospora aff. communis PSN243]